MKLRLEIENASPEEQKRGIEAAMAVFAATGISAAQAADGMSALEGWDDASFAADEEPTAEEDKAADVWMEAKRPLSPRAAPTGPRMQCRQTISSSNWMIDACAAVTPDISPGRKSTGSTG